MDKKNIRLSAWQAGWFGIALALCAVLLFIGGTGTSAQAGAAKAASPNVTCPAGQCFTDVPPGNGFFDNITPSTWMASSVAIPAVARASPAMPTTAPTIGQPTWYHASRCPSSSTWGGATSLMLSASPYAHQPHRIRLVIIQPQPPMH